MIRYNFVIRLWEFAAPTSYLCGLLDMFIQLMAHCYLLGCVRQCVFQ